MKTVAIKLSRIKETGERLNRPGFYDEYLAQGEVKGDELIVSKKFQLAMRLKYRLRVGSAVAFVAKPIARAIDSVAGTNLKNCGGCKQREEDWNNISEKVVEKYLEKRGKPLAKGRNKNISSKHL